MGSGTPGVKLKMAQLFSSDPNLKFNLFWNRSETAYCLILSAIEKIIQSPGYLFLFTFSMYPILRMWFLKKTLI